MYIYILLLLDSNGCTQQLKMSCREYTLQTFACSPNSHPMTPNIRQHYIWVTVFCLISLLPSVIASSLYTIYSIPGTGIHPDVNLQWRESPPLSVWTAMDVLIDQDAFNNSQKQFVPSIFDPNGMNINSELVFEFFGSQRSSGTWKYATIWSFLVDPAFLNKDHQVLSWWNIFDYAMHSYKAKAQLGVPMSVMLSGPEGRWNRHGPSSGKQLAKYLVCRHLLCHCRQLLFGYTMVGDGCIMPMQQL